MDELNPRKLNREQLSSFLPSHELVKAFEALFRLAGATPDEINALTVAVQDVALLASAGVGAAAAARGEAARLRDEVSLIERRPRFVMPRALSLDYLDFNRNPAHENLPGRLTWNADDDTLNIHHEDGVTQQVGLETYIRVQNSTGSTITNGSVVGFGGASGGFVQGVPYIADGSFPAGYLGGVATEDIPDGEVGRVTVFGFVRDLDTSAFAVGDILYASPSVAGELTATKPTAPDIAIPLAVVSVDDASSGVIFVRPILEQTKHYGTFLKTSDQTPAAINTAYTITFDSSAVASGFSIGTPSSRIVAEFAGLYTFSASFQLVSGSASVKNVWVWFRKNGTDVPDSSLKLSLDSSTAVNTQFRSLFFSLSAGDYIELMWAADSTNVTLDNIAATAFAPAAPAVVLTVDQIQQ